jgi:hypothetical protein
MFYWIGQVASLSNIFVNLRIVIECKEKLFQLGWVGGRLWTASLRNQSGNIMCQIWSQCTADLMWATRACSCIYKYVHIHVCYVIRKACAWPAIKLGTGQPEQAISPRGVLMEASRRHWGRASESSSAETWDRDRPP